MPWASAIALRRTGCGSPWRAANSTIATQAYSAFLEMCMGGCSIDPPSAVHPRLDAAAVLVLDHVQAALLLHPARPAAGPFVLAGRHRPRARPAADARVAAV